MTPMTAKRTSTQTTEKLPFPTLSDLSVKGKTVLVRTDLNVPMQGGTVTDATRIMRLLPTLNELTAAGAKVVILSHLGRPKGQFVPAKSLSSLVDPLSQALGREVRFGVDCVGAAAKEAVSHTKFGEVLLLENLRFHAEEEKNDVNFAKALASLGDIYVNDAFSASHRAHASVAAIATLLPHAAGRLMEEELGTLGCIFSSSAYPLGAVVGGSKISTKLALLDTLVDRVDVLLIGGAMAHTFLVAQGLEVGTSLYEPDLVETASRILAHAKTKGCNLLLPVDAVVSEEFAPRATSRIVPVTAIPKNMMMLDVGPRTVQLFADALSKCKTMVWNGPLGAFETPPFDVSTIQLARHVASLTGEKKLESIAGGGDTVSALTHAGLAGGFSYLSTAGGAFLEWLEGKTLPGVEALMQKTK